MIVGKSFHLLLSNINNSLIELQINLVHNWGKNVGEIGTDLSQLVSAAKEIMEIRLEAKKIQDLYKREGYIGPKTNNVNEILNNNYINEAIINAIENCSFIRNETNIINQSNNHSNNNKSNNNNNNQSNNNNKSNNNQSNNNNNNNNNNNSLNIIINNNNPIKQWENIELLMSRMTYANTIASSRTEITLLANETFARIFISKTVKIFTIIKNYMINNTYNDLNINNYNYSNMDMDMDMDNIQNPNSNPNSNPNFNPNSNPNPINYEELLEDLIDLCSQYILNNNHNNNNNNNKTMKIYGYNSIIDLIFNSSLILIHLLRAELNGNYEILDRNWKKPLYNNNYSKITHNNNNNNNENNINKTQLNESNISESVSVGVSVRRKSQLIDTINPRINQLIETINDCYSMQSILRTARQMNNFHYYIDIIINKKLLNLEDMITFNEINELINKQNNNNYIIYNNNSNNINNINNINNEIIIIHENININEYLYVKERLVSNSVEITSKSVKLLVKSFLFVLNLKLLILNNNNNNNNNNQTNNETISNNNNETISNNNNNEKNNIKEAFYLLMNNLCVPNTDTDNSTDQTNSQTNTDTAMTHNTTHNTTDINKEIEFLELISNNNYKYNYHLLIKNELLLLINYIINKYIQNIFIDLLINNQLNGTQQFVFINKMNEKSDINNEKSDINNEKNENNIPKIIEMLKYSINYSNITINLGLITDRIYYIRKLLTNSIEIIGSFDLIFQNNDKTELLSDKTELFNDKTELLSDKTELFNEKIDFLNEKNGYLNNNFTDLRIFEISKQLAIKNIDLLLLIKDNIINETIYNNILIENNLIIKYCKYQLIIQKFHKLLLINILIYNNNGLIINQFGFLLLKQIINELTQLFDTSNEHTDSGYMNGLNTQTDMNETDRLYYQSLIIIMNKILFICNFIETNHFNNNYNTNNNSNNEMNSIHISMNSFINNNNNFTQKNINELLYNNSNINFIEKNIQINNNNYKSFITSTSTSMSINPNETELNENELIVPSLIAVLRPGSEIFNEIVTHFIELQTHIHQLVDTIATTSTATSTNTSMNTSMNNAMNNTNGMNESNVVTNECPDSLIYLNNIIENLLIEHNSIIEMNQLLCTHEIITQLSNNCDNYEIKVIQTNQLLSFNLSNNNNNNNNNNENNMIINEHLQLKNNFFMFPWLTSLQELLLQIDTFKESQTNEQTHTSSQSHSYGQTNAQTHTIEFTFEIYINYVNYLETIELTSLMGQIMKQIIRYFIELRYLLLIKDYINCQLLIYIIYAYINRTIATDTSTDNPTDKSTDKSMNDFNNNNNSNNNNNNISQYFNNYLIINELNNINEYLQILYYKRTFEQSIMLCILPPIIGFSTLIINNQLSLLINDISLQKILSDIQTSDLNDISVPNTQTDARDALNNRYLSNKIELKDIITLGTLLVELITSLRHNNWKQSLLMSNNSNNYNFINNL